RFRARAELDARETHPDFARDTAASHGLRVQREPSIADTERARAELDRDAGELSVGFCDAARGYDRARRRAEPIDPKLQLRSLRAHGREPFGQPMQEPREVDRALRVPNLGIAGVGENKQ